MERSHLKDQGDTRITYSTEELVPLVNYFLGKAYSAGGMNKQ